MSSKFTALVRLPGPKRHPRRGESQQIEALGPDAVYQRTTLSVHLDGQLVEDGFNTLMWRRTPAGWKVSSDMWTAKPQAPAANN